MTDDLQELQERQEKFIQERDWEQFHTPKSIAMALSVEANELVELFQWHDNLPAEAYQDHPEVQEDVQDELADVLIYVFSMATRLDIDLAEAVDRKFNKNNDRFDLETSERISDELSNWKLSE